MSQEIDLGSNIDQLFENLPMGSVRRALGNNLYGINATQTGNPVPRSKDSHGFTFLTRPQLNLTTFNVSNFRSFYSLLTSEEASYQRYVRMMLDPRLGYGSNPLKCPFVDNQNAFIPIMTNNALSLGGGMDINAPTFTSKAGNHGQEYGFVDGTTNHLESFDVDITFRNMRGNPLIYLAYIWVRYQTLVFEGILNPYYDMITENEIDYNTRIYRITLDQTKRYVSYIACTGASFPINVPTSMLFDYNVDKPYADTNGDINLRFRSFGLLQFEDIVKLDFNEATAIFNPGIRALLRRDLDNEGSHDYLLREDPFQSYVSPTGEYTKIPHNLLLLTESSIGNNPFFGLNHRAYPYINLHTNELEWWVNSRLFNERLNQFKAAGNQRP